MQTLAFVLPNDERIREEKGTKKVFLKNIQEAKFEKALVPISKKVLVLEGDGNYDKASAFIAEYGKVDGEIQSLLDSLTDIPVDIEPIYKIEAESSVSPSSQSSS